ncbi:glycosyltransferase family 4 protein [Methylobacillus flagellatus]|uniref:Glycosyl transferase, group 1 n=1 Tax=Methylobacillus flagellatus (strain ATCC 51484 / DSM 6875 / VKM B-1610 / KT) TaxID=265072 RepID=Q1H1U6_METFK|nr:glycosyltransferase family 1 protein [Methylobacillus flagellatus]ABE49541.1 glycosyl transferase, group 1 [Methylobacillus flagellatus KT]
MMKVGFGVTVLTRCLALGGIDGIGSYTRELMKRLEADPAVELFPISYGYSPSQFPIGSRAPTTFGRYAPLAAVSAVSGFPFLGTAQLKERVDLIHAPDHLIPNYGKVPVIASIMDAIPLSHPEWVSPKLRKMKNALWKRSAHWASHIITISEYSKQEISQHFGIEAQKISAIPLGVDERWFQPLEEEAMKVVLRRYNLPQYYFLVVGTLQPRKNVGRVIEAYRSLPQGIRNEVPLVIVGRAGWRCEDVVEMLTSSSSGNSLRWLKHLPDADLLAVLKGATALVFPSLYEGFGLPVVEAFAAGTPVITSNTTSLPEVAGDAAMLVNPLNVSDIAAAMQSMLEQPELAESFRNKGQERALAYSWDKTASMTLDVYKKTREAA